MKTRIFLLVILSAFVFTNCEKNKDDGNKEVLVVLDVTDDLVNWRYYSFSSGKEVTVTDYTDDLNWDLGIHYENFRTNGGKSGKGQGAVLDLGETGYDAVTIASIEGKTFVEDDSITVLASENMIPFPTFMNTPGSVPLEDMFLTPQGPGPRLYTPNEHVYVIRTANGKYVKLLGVTFFNDLGKEGYFTFKYDFLD